MIFPLDNHDEYKSLCLEAWQLNSEFWDKTRKINQQVKDFIFKELKNSGEEFKIADVGCGNGWLLDDLTLSGHKFSYCGIDFNSQFIDTLKKKHTGHEWHHLDFTLPLSSFPKNKFDIVVSCLSIIEMACLAIPFQNFNQILSDNGNLILITLNPYFEIIRLSDNYIDLENDIEIFRSSESSKYYKKEIIIDKRGTGNFYYGVLHPPAYLTRSFLNNNFSIVRFEELNFLEGKIKEPIYHAYSFKKNGGRTK